MNNLIETYTRLADIRGYSKTNPILFKIPVDGIEFILVYSEREPHKAELPVNVLWLEHLTGILRIRESIQPNNDFEYTWSELNVESAFLQPPRYERMPIDYRDIALDAHSIVGEADVGVSGFVKLLEPNTNAVVVPDTDPRLFNPRRPKEHDHEDFPRTLIRINEHTTGVLDIADQPEPGSVLFIDRKLENSYYACKWRMPDFDEIDWSIPKLESLGIYLPEGVVPSDNSQFTLKTRAYWTDRVEEQSVVRWSIEENPYGITIGRSGQITCPNLSEDITIKVSVTKQDPFYKHTVTDEYTLTIKNLYDLPLGLSIEGADTLYEDSAEQYSYYMDYESGARKLISPKTTTTTLGKLVAGTFTPGLVDDHTDAKLFATGIVDGISFAAEKTVTVLKNKLVSVDFYVGGEVVSELAVDEGSRLTLGTYRLMFEKGNSTTVGVASMQGLIADNHDFVEDITPTFVKFTHVFQESTVVLSDSITHRGDTATASLTVTLLDVYPSLEEIVINSLAEIGPNILELSPYYKRPGVQSAPSLVLTVEAIAGVSTPLASALDGLTYDVNWKLLQPTPYVTLNVIADSDDSEAVLQMDTANSSGFSEEFVVDVKATVFVHETQKSVSYTKSITVKPMDLSKLVGPIIVGTENGELTTDLTINRNADGDAGFIVSSTSIILIDEDKHNLPITEIDSDTIRFSSSQSNTNVNKNFTYLDFDCPDYVVDVMVSKVSYTWRTVVWIRNIESGVTFDLNITDPRINKTYTQKFTTN